MHLVQTLLLGSLQQLCEETHHRFSTLSTIPGNDEDDSKRYELGLIHNLKCFFLPFYTLEFCCKEIVKSLTSKHMARQRDLVFK